jgi:hypothetical protein
MLPGSTEKTVNFDKDSFSYFPVPIAAALQNWQGGGLAPNNKIFLPPYDSNVILVIDTKNTSGIISTSLSLTSGLYLGRCWGISATFMVVLALQHIFLC